MTRVTNRRPAFALAALLFALPFACGSAHYSGPASDADSATTAAPSGALSSVGFARAQLHGAEPEQPAPSQRALLAESELTHADYASAMREMAACVEQRLPGATVELYRGSVRPELFDLTVSYVAPEGQRTAFTDAADDPANLVMAQCELGYSAYVQDKWEAQQPPALDQTGTSADVEIRAAGLQDEGAPGPARTAVRAR